MTVKQRLERFYTRNLIAVAMCIMFFIMLVGFIVIGNSVDDIEDLRRQDVQNTIDRRVEICQTTNTSRLMIRSLFQSAMDSNSPLLGIDFEEIDGWEDLSAETQLYLQGLSSSLSNPETSEYILELMGRYSITNPIEDCEQARVSLEAELQKEG